MGKVWVVADTTYREIARQPLYYILTGFFALVIFLSRFFTLFTFREGDEANMIREMGIASITISGVLLSVIMASIVITSEVEKLTTLTVLSKPIGRGQFLVGKYLGIVLANLFSVSLLLIVLVYTLWQKEALHELEKAGNLLEIPEGGRAVTPEFYFPFVGRSPVTFGIYLHLVEFFTTVAPVFHATVLSFFQIVVLAAIAVGIAPHFSLVVNGSASFVLFAMGHLTQYIHLQSEDGSLLWRIPAQLLYIALPNLTYFNAASLLATRSDISTLYVCTAGLYGVVYIAVIMLVANLFFSRKEVR